MTGIGVNGGSEREFVTFRVGVAFRGFRPLDPVLGGFDSEWDP